jgi:hypothetical protein
VVELKKQGTTASNANHYRKFIGALFKQIDRVEMAGKLSSQDEAAPRDRKADSVSLGTGAGTA